MISRTIRVLLVGGIGTGKTTLAGYFRDRGALTIDADRLGHEVLESEAKGAVARRWPEVIEGGTVDRAALAEIVFNDVDQLRELERMTHPHIAARIAAQAAEATEALVVVELPVSPSLLDADWITVLVTADPETRLRRVLARGMSEQDARARMAAQQDPTGWDRRVDLVFDNNGPLEQLPARVDELIRRLRSMAPKDDTPAP